MQLDFPYHFDGRDRTAETDEADHVRDLIEQILFTNPGERVMRPDFGAGISQLVFAPVSAEQVATTEFMVRGALQQYLGRRIEVIDVRAEGVEATVFVTIAFRLLSGGRTSEARFELGGAA